MDMVEAESATTVAAMGHAKSGFANVARAVVGADFMLTVMSRHESENDDHLLTKATREGGIVQIGNGPPSRRLRDRDHRMYKLVQGGGRGEMTQIIYDSFLELVGISGREQMGYVVRKLLKV